MKKLILIISALLLLISFAGCSANTKTDCNKKGDEFFHTNCVLGLIKSSVLTNRQTKRKLDKNKNFWGINLSEEGQS